MNLYDIDRNCSTTLSEIQANIQHYAFYIDGEELEFKSLNQIEEQVGKKTQGVVIIRQKKNPAALDSKVDYQKLMNVAAKEGSFSNNYLQMLKQDPSLLFEKQMFRFKYGLLEEEGEVSAQREEELVSAILAGSASWKQASLEEMQTISKSYLKLLKRSLSNSSN